MSEIKTLSEEKHQVRLSAVPEILPDKPSAMIRLAIADMKALMERKDLKYKIDMNTWHENDGRGTCYVCLAGSVMANTLKVPHEEDIEPFDLSNPQVADKLRALNEFRKGSIISGLIMFYQMRCTLDFGDFTMALSRRNLPTLPQDLCYRKIYKPMNDYGWGRFYAEMDAMASMLALHGH